MDSKGNVHDPFARGHRHARERSTVSQRCRRYEPQKVVDSGQDDPGEEDSSRMALVSKCPGVFRGQQAAHE